MYRIYAAKMLRKALILILGVRALAFIDKLKDIVKTGIVAENEPMSLHCSFKTGGNADYFVSPGNFVELAEVIKAAKEENIAFTLIGNGSNLLVSDKGIRGVVIQLGSLMAEIKGENGEYIVDAGALLSAAAAKICEDSYTGFEFASGIPGSMGGALVMNAGAYGGEMKDVVKWVRVLDENLEIKTLTNEEMDFGYRRSAASEKGYIILQGCVSLEKGDKEEIKRYSAELNGRRRDKQPLNFPSAGSTFKRPVGHFAGKLIEDANLKGYTLGGAKVSEKHAGFIINYNSATFLDVINLTEEVKKIVKEKFNVELELEVEIL